MQTIVTTGSGRARLAQMRHHGKSICFASRAQMDAPARNADISISAHAGPHSFDQRTNFVESRHARLLHPSSVGETTPLTGLSSHAPVVVAMPVSKEGSVAIPTLPAVLPGHVVPSCKASVESEGGDVGFPTSPQSSHAVPFPVLSCHFPALRKVTISTPFRRFFRFAPRI